MFAESAGFKSKALMILSVRNVCSNPGSNSNHDVYHVFLSEINTFADWSSTNVLFFIKQ